ncbi:uncharacterized protein METZ01_LOCUS290297 [marine metagenome]|uniref:Uncharacterized protein n=1 Tax=marine metagenome TaxID=408172 RepID=A0A382LMC1_9ZZZZ
MMEAFMTGLSSSILNLQSLVVSVASVMADTVLTLIWY